MKAARFDESGADAFEAGRDGGGVGGEGESDVPFAGGTELAAGANGDAVCAQVGDHRDCRHLGVVAREGVERSVGASQAQSADLGESADQEIAAAAVVLVHHRQISGRFADGDEGCALGGGVQRSCGQGVHACSRGDDGGFAGEIAQPVMA